MKVSIVIVNYNVKYFLEQCLVSLHRAIKGIDTEIFVVDNNSSDGSLQYLESRFPNVIFIANKENVGFSKANNLAIRRAKGEYVLLINPDTFVGETLITDCLNLMDSTPQAGGVGVRMYGADGAFAFESRRGFPSPMTSFYKIIGLCSLFPYSRRFGKYHMRYLNENEINKIDVISGACMFLRKEALDKAGLLDETFFMYGEDIDLSYRITLAGYQNYYIPSPIIHYKGESTKKDSFKYVYIFYDAMIIFFKKHYPHYSIFFSFFVKLMIYFRAFLAMLYRGLGKIKSFFGFAPKKKEPCFLVLAKENALKEIESICRNNELTMQHHYTVTNEELISTEELNLPLEQFTHIVFDSSVFSYNRMIEIISSLSGKYDIELGTYSSNARVLITSRRIYS